MNELSCLLEGILFASGEPVYEEKLRQVLGIDAEQLHQLAQELADSYDAEKRGFQIIRLQDSYQMVSRAEYADTIRRALEVRRTPSLSAAALEVLSIVAYRQPVTRAYIEQLRGVDSSNTVLNLLDKGLLEGCLGQKTTASEFLEGCGRLDVPGRPMIYRTTPAFLRAFSISSLDELPDLPELRELEEKRESEQEEAGS